MKKIISIGIIIFVLFNYAMVYAEVAPQISNVQVDRNNSIITITGRGFPQELSNQYIQLISDTSIYAVSQENILQYDSQTIKFSMPQGMSVGEYYVGIRLNQYFLHTDICHEVLPTESIQGSFSDVLTLNSGSYYINGNLTIEETGSLICGEYVKLVVKSGSSIVIKGSLSLGEGTNIICFGGNFDMTIESSGNLIKGVYFKDLANGLVLKGNNTILNCYFRNCITAVSLYSENSNIKNCGFSDNTNAITLNGGQNKIQFCDFSGSNVDVNWINGENNELRYNDFYGAMEKNIKAQIGNNFLCKYNYFNYSVSDVSIESPLECRFYDYIKASGTDMYKKVGETFEVKLLNMFPEYDPTKIEMILPQNANGITPLREDAIGTYTAINPGEVNIKLVIDDMELSNFTIKVSSSLECAPFDITMRGQGYSSQFGDNLDSVNFEIVVETQTTSQEPVYYTLMIATYDAQKKLISTKKIEKQAGGELSIETIPLTKKAYYIKCLVWKPNTMLPYSLPMEMGDGVHSLI